MNQYPVTNSYKDHYDQPYQPPTSTCNAAVPLPSKLPPTVESEAIGQEVEALHPVVQTPDSNQGLMNKLMNKLMIHEKGYQWISYA